MCRLAALVPANGVIVEVGSYEGKSTVCLGLGALEARAGVWAIDSYAGYMEGSKHYFGMQSHAALLRNLAAFELGSTVRVVALSSAQAVCGWRESIDLLFIDAGHDYRSVKHDFEAWSALVQPHGKVAMHDTSGLWPGVAQLVDEIIQAGEWKRIQMVDTISVFERVVQP